MLVEVKSARDTLGGDPGHSQIGHQGPPEIMPKYRSVANAFTNSEKLARLLSSQMPAIPWPGPG